MSRSGKNILLLCLFATIISLAEQQPITLVDFEESMQTHTLMHLVLHGNAHIFGFPPHVLLDTFKQLYDKNKEFLTQPSNATRIPRYIHVIWLGGQLPEAYEPFYHSWLDHHPSWTHIFWTDNPANYQFGSVICKSFDELNACLEAHSDKSMRIVVDTTHLCFENKQFFDASKNYGERSDILRLEIVYRYGGVYVDTDCECLQPLDQLNYCYDFYAGLHPLDTYYVQIGTALFAAIPSHPLLRVCVDGIKNNQHIDSSNNIASIIEKTGPVHVTRSFLNHHTTDNHRNIIFPATYFYPCGWSLRSTLQKEWFTKEAFAVHHWEGSWLKAEGFLRS